MSSHRVFEFRASRPSEGLARFAIPDYSRAASKNAVRFFRGERMNHWTRRKFFLTTFSASVAAGARNLFGRTVTGGNTLLALPGGKHIATTPRTPLNTLNTPHHLL